MAKTRRKNVRPPRKRRRLKPRRRAKPRGPRAIEIALAGLAHDIRTPLTGILALADLLQNAGLPERERAWAEAIKGAADHLARLTTVVVDTAKADSTGLVLRAEPFAPRDLANAVAGSLAARAHGKGLDVAIDIARDLPVRLLGDEVRLRSALENLVDNAVKFTERGRIAFSAQAARAGRGRVRLRFTVEDSGIGIVAADLKRLFHPFAQASAEVARRYGGSGLGLLFVKRIARAMGGDLKVASKAGRGSTFRMDVVVGSEKPGASSRAVRGGSRGGLRVLCVEDNPFGRVVLSTVLRELGHTVSFAGSGEAAVAAAARAEHDAILMDIALPGIDGIEAARRIRALPEPAGRIPIIGVSGRTEARDAVAAKQAGMNVYLRKPATPAELSDALASVVRVRRAGSAG